MIGSAGRVTLEYEVVFGHHHRPCLVLSHPHPLFGGTMDHKIIRLLFQRCKQSGFSAIRFNFRGVGQSTGCFEYGVGELADLAAVVDYVQAKGLSEGGLHLVGYSFGAWITTQYLNLPIDSCASIQRAIQSMVLIAPPLGLFSFSERFCSSLIIDVHVAEADSLVERSRITSWFNNLRNQDKHLHLYPGADHDFVGMTSKLVDQILNRIKVNSDKTCNA